MAIALALTTVFLLAELVGAFVFKSLALLSDAVHRGREAEQGSRSANALPSPLTAP